MIYFISVKYLLCPMNINFNQQKLIALLIEITSSSVRLVLDLHTKFLIIKVKFSKNPKMIDRISQEKILTQESKAKNKIQPNQTDILLTETCTQCQKEFQLSDIENMQSKVIEIESGQYFCEQCLEQRLIHEQQQVKSLEEKFIYYKEYESSFNPKEYSQLKTIQESQDETQTDLNQLKQLEEEEALLKEMLNNAQEECAKLREKVIQIESEEEKFWDSINRFEKRSIKLEEKSLAAKLQKGAVAEQCEELTNKSLFHTIFKVTIQDNIGYLSGLAMGKKSEASDINWQEFNIALGHLFLGMNILIMKYEYSYVKFSKVFLKSNLTEVILYGRDKKVPISYSKQNEKNFGEVMETLLSEIAHFTYHLLEVLDLEYNPDVRLPYPIKERDFKIADIPINPLKIIEKQKLSKWSEAVKYLLINFKHLLTVHVIFGKN